MTAPDTFSIAVVRGPGLGQVLRTERKRISVGRGDDNDLILQDREIAPRHFLILIDQGRWRIHTLSPEKHITVDRRWAHPNNGRRGALVQAGPAELIIYPGHLEPNVIDREIQLRARGEMPSYEESATDLVTQIASIPAEFGYEDAQSMPTMPVPKHLVDDVLATAVDPPNPKDDPELVKLSMLPTIAGERPPEEIRQAARVRLMEERAPLAPSLLLEHERNQPVRLPDEIARAEAGRPRYSDDKTAAIGWDDEKLEIKPIERFRKHVAGVAGAETVVDDDKAPMSAWDRAKQKLGTTDNNKPGRSAGADLRVIRTPPPEGAAAPLPDVRTKSPVPSAKPQNPRASGTANAAMMKPKSNPIVPEVLAEAESDVRPIPAPDGSRLHSLPAPDGSRIHFSPIESSVMPSPPISVDGQDGKKSGETSPKSKNAWGDPLSRVMPTPVPHPPANARKGSERSSDRPSDRSSERNGRALQPQRDPRMLMPQKPSHIISVQDLAKRAIDPALAILQDPDGEFATSIRLFSTKLEEYMRTHGYRAYMMTSAEPLTGKTTAACNLAFALAEDTHRRVALVEANFRHPRLAEIFGIPEDHGLIPLLEGRVQIAETIVKMSDRNLVIMPSGGRYPHPGELLASPRFKMLIAELANTVDIAVIDAPPVSPFADANMLLPLLDAAVLVVAEGRTKVTDVAEAGQQLGMTRIIGGLYNKIPKQVLKDLKLELKARATD